MSFVLIFAVICAYIVKGMCGFANTLIFSTIMSFTTSNINITPMELIVGYFSNIFIAVRERKGIRAKVWIPLTIMVIIGIIPGVLFLKNGSTALVKTFFGFTIVFIGLEMMLRERLSHKKESSKLVLTIFGFISGILCGLYGIGAILALYIGRTTKNQNEFKGNICLVLVIENTFRIILYSMIGILNLAIIKQSVVLIPFMIIGLMTGILLSKRFSETFVKKAVIILLILSGVSLVINNIRL